MRMILRLAGMLATAATLAAAQQPIQVITRTLPVDAMSFADIDFVHSASPRWLFSIELRIPSGSVEAVMTLRLETALSTGDVFPEAAYLETIPFTISPTRVFSNTDFQNSSLVREYRTDANARRRYQDIALSGTSMPSGTYTIHVDVRPTGGGTPGTGELTFILRNPSGVELLYPFDGDQEVSLFPLFQWRFDGARSRIRVFEKLPGQATAEEAASGVAQVVADVTSGSFQYPAAGVRALEPGKSYVWFVEGYSRTAGGTDQIARSAIRTFTVSAGGGGTRSLASYLEELERALGPRFAPVFDQIRSGLFAPTGELRLDGSAISTVDLLRLITLLRTQPDAVLSVTLE